MNDYFKIVAVLKKRGATAIVEYSYVPHKWENSGILYWPKANLKSLREDPGSEPQEDWTKFKCKVKKNHIIGCEEAELWEEQFVNASGTDVEDSLCISKTTIKPKCIQSGGKTAYDEMFEQNPSSQSVSQVVNDVLNQDSNSCIISGNSDPSSDPMSGHSAVYAVSVGDYIEYNPDLIETQTTQTEMFNKCGCKEIEAHEGIKTMLERQERMYERFSGEFLQLKLTNDSMYKILKDIQARVGLAENKIDQARARAETETLSKRFLFPLNTHSDILNFNKEIEDNSEYKTYLIKKYTSIGGSDGCEDGKIIARKLLAVLFSKYVLTLFSWTGISRTKGLEKKESFQSCQGILSLFHLVIEKADSRWNESKNEKFFKTHILKHAKQINEAHEKKMKKKSTNSSEAANQVITEIDSENDEDLGVSLLTRIEEEDGDSHLLRDQSSQ